MFASILLILDSFSETERTVIYLKQDERNETSQEYNYKAKFHTGQSSDITGQPAQDDRAEPPHR
jgi:hypothetical protein